MSRSLFVSLSSCVLMALLLSSGSAVAQGFSEADLVGDYAFEAETESVLGRAVDLEQIGRFTADGMGGVMGVRWFSRPLLTPSATGAMTERVEQSFVGTYLVEADGTGMMTIEPTPNPDWNDDPRNLQVIRFDRPETMLFALADGGRHLLFDLELSAKRIIPSAPDDELHRIDYTFSGNALAQAPSDDLADDLADLSDRVDLLTDLVARLSAQNCEVLRLLNTPQGQRETSSPEVVEACGTGYEWNAEGPRRGR